MKSRIPLLCVKRVSSCDSNEHFLKSTQLCELPRILFDLQISFFLMGKSEGNLKQQYYFRCFCLNLNLNESSGNTPFKPEFFILINLFCQQCITDQISGAFLKIILLNKGLILFLIFLIKQCKPLLKA